MYDGLNAASSLFVDYTISRLDEVKQLHAILLVIVLVVYTAYVVFLFRPYARSLIQDSRSIAGMLSQLPADVDVEGHVRSVILNSTDHRSSNNNSNDCNASNNKSKQLLIEASGSYKTAVAAATAAMPRA